ncbi:MAG: GTPase domain-containing protein [Chrysiogenetes bacterium]|nr:GTPase domain-containing protein [Chrysiogenetes bacterium]
MAQINAAAKEINAKIVYYGPGRSGKTTNIQYVHAKLKHEHKGELMTLSTEQDRTLFFDFLPVDLGEVRGLRTRFHLYTVPGQIFYNSTRKLVLKNADGIVFVADSEAKYLNENIESFKNLIENLKVHGRDPKKIPILIQYNKRDREGAMTLEELNRAVNTLGLPTIEAVASRGQGVLQTLTMITKMVMRELSAGAIPGGNQPMFTGPRSSASVAAPPMPPPASPASAPVPVDDETTIDEPLDPLPPMEPAPSLESSINDDEEEDALAGLGPDPTSIPAPSTEQEAAPAQSDEESFEVEIDVSDSFGEAPAAEAPAHEAGETDEAPKRLEMVALNAVERRGELEVILEVQLRDPETGQLYLAPLQLTLGGAYTPK